MLHFPSFTAAGFEPGSIRSRDGERIYRASAGRVGMCWLPHQPERFVNADDLVHPVPARIASEIAISIEKCVGVLGDALR